MSMCWAYALRVFPQRSRTVRAKIITDTCLVPKIFSQESLIDT